MADGSRWTDWTPFTYPFNLTRQPAATVPCGLTSAGLAAGLQIVGPSHGDVAVLPRRPRLREAAALQAAADLRLSSRHSLLSSFPRKRE